MILSNFLFSSPVRVWNLRLLLLETIGVSTFLVITFPLHALESRDTFFYLPWEILFSTFGFILLHHGTLVRNWPVPGLAIIDLILIFLEACGIAAGFIFGTGSFFLWEQLGLFPRLLNLTCIPLGLSLALSTIFRTATIIRSNGRFFRQRFVFLGACIPSNPPYTPTAILLNRSVARPLVRGESVVIIIARALILSCIAVGVPIFGIYAMVISPIRASVYTRSVATFAAADLGSPPGNITFVMVYSTFDFTPPFGDFAVNSITVPYLNQLINCPVTFEDHMSERLVECPLPWTSLDRSVSINLSIPLGSVVAVTPLQGRPVLKPIKQLDSELHSVRLHVPTDSILMVSGSHLFGRLTWIQRETASGFVIGSSSTATKPVYAAEITGLQTYPSVNSTISPDSATLVLFQPQSQATKLQQDTSDVSLFSGLATFGGFWTFVNGAFALFFGANVVYFAFGRRPLSALGLAHIFQRHTLARQWHADFPALRTEGGQPGSESAGVVAFIRERLIDIDQEPQMVTKNDLEAQRPPLDHDDPVMSFVGEDDGRNLEDTPFITRSGISGWPTSGSN